MSLAERLKEAKEAASAAKLSAIDEYVESLDETDRVALFERITEPNPLPIRVLHEVVVAEGVKIGRDKFTAWLYANGYKR